MEKKESKFKSFLKKVGNVVKGSKDSLFSIAGSIATGNVSGAISKTFALLSGEDTAEAKELLAELELKKQEFEIEEMKMIIADRDSARDMQANALKQEDKFSKRFIYYLSSAMFLFSAFVVTLLFFVEIPQENKRIVDMILGIVIGTGLVSMLNFFYGASPRE